MLDTILRAFFQRVKKFGEKWQNICIFLYLPPKNHQNRRNAEDFGRGKKLL